MDVGTSDASIQAMHIQAVSVCECELGSAIEGLSTILRSCPRGWNLAVGEFPFCSPPLTAPSSGDRA